MDIHRSNQAADVDTHVVADKRMTDPVDAEEELVVGSENEMVDSN